MPTEFIVMTANAKMPSSCRGIYKKVAVVEVEVGVYPKMISERARGVVRIVSFADKLHAGKGGPKTAFALAVEDADRLCAGLNLEADRKRARAEREREARMKSDVLRLLEDNN